jgi:hypothetical protein
VRDGVRVQVGDCVGVSVGALVTEGVEVGVELSVAVGDAVTVGVGSPATLQPISLNTAVVSWRDALETRNGSMSSSGRSKVSKWETEDPSRRSSGAYMRMCPSLRPLVRLSPAARALLPTQCSLPVSMADAARCRSIMSGHSRPES